MIPRRAASTRPARPLRHRAVTLPLLATLLLGSGLLRFGTTGIAAAREAAQGTISTTRDAAPAPACEPPPDTAALLAAVRSRADRLDRREARIADRMQALHVAETAIERKMADLVAEEESLASTLTIADSAAESDVARLTAVYESMKPKIAAEVFAAMTPEFAAGFLGRMRPEAAAGILSGLEPGRAYAISVVLAGRNAGAPEE